LVDQPFERFEKVVDQLPESSLHERVREDLSTSVIVEDYVDISEEIDGDEGLRADSDTE
jgi:hypothetical protein